MEPAVSSMQCRYCMLFLPSQLGMCSGDALRPFLLHAFGGLYLDVDVECFEAVDESLDGFDVVLQLEDGGNKSLNNAVMAGMPGHPLWAKMQVLMHERCVSRPCLVRCPLLELCSGVICM